MKSASGLISPGRSECSSLFIATAITTCAIAAFGFLASGASAGDHSALPESLTGPETMLVKSLQEIAESRMDSALSGVEQLIKTNPNFRLAHLIKGDLLLARSRPISNMGDTSDVSQQHLADLREEARARLQRHRETIPRNMTPKYLVQMPSGTKICGYCRHRQITAIYIRECGRACALPRRLLHQQRQEWVPKTEGRRQENPHRRLFCHC